MEGSEDLTLRRTEFEVLLGHRVDMPGRQLDECVLSLREREHHCGAVSISELLRGVRRAGSQRSSMEGEDTGSAAWNQISLLSTVGFLYPSLWIRGHSLLISVLSPLRLCRANAVSINGWRGKCILPGDQESTDVHSSR